MDVYCVYKFISCLAEYCVYSVQCVTDCAYFALICIICIGVYCVYGCVLSVSGDTFCIDVLFFSPKQMNYKRKFT